MNESPINPPYEGVVIDFRLIKTIPMKLYLTDFLGRDSPVYEWCKTKILPSRLIAGLENELWNTNHVGVPHIAVAFPHITTVYRFGDPRFKDERETNVYLVGRASTSEQENIILRVTQDPFAIGCLLESNPILSEEISFWANSQTVDDYLAKHVAIGSSIKVADPNKLRKKLAE